MKPILFQIGSFPVRSYGLMLVIGFYVALSLASRRAKKFGMNPSIVFDSSLWLIGLGILGARVFFIAQEWKHYSTHPAQLWSLQFQGLTSFGGYVFGFIALVVWCKVKRASLVTMMDILAPPALVANAIGRIGCLLNGCCHGHKCLPGAWGVHVEGFPGLYQPAQVYESVFNLLAFGFVLWLEKKRTQAGLPGGMAFIMLGVCRFIYEFWRAGTPADVDAGIASSSYIKGLPITDAQLVALLFVVFGAIWWLVAARKANDPENENRLTDVESLS